ncbi:hypothetical protein [Metallibacterium sp.]
MIAWLRAHGFGLLGAYNMTNDRDGRAVQADFLEYPDLAVGNHTEW